MQESESNLAFANLIANIYIYLINTSYIESKHTGILGTMIIQCNRR